MRKTITKLTTILSAAALTILPSVAQAGTGAGGGYRDCSRVKCKISNQILQWHYLSNDPVGLTAWEKFTQPYDGTYTKSGHRADLIMDRFNSLSSLSGVGDRENLINICKSSETIWYVTGHNFSYGGDYLSWMSQVNTSHPDGMFPRNFMQASPADNSSLNSGLTSRVYQWAVENDPGQRDYTIICSSVSDLIISEPPPSTTSTTPSSTTSTTPSNTSTTTTSSPSPSTSYPPRVITDTEYRDEGNPPQVNNAYWDGVYSYTTTVQRQNIGTNGDPAGELNLHDQQFNPNVTDGSQGYKKTHFGRLYDRVHSGDLGSISTDSLRSMVNQAKALDAQEGHAHMDLDAANKQGLAEGGVLNFNEYTRYARITSRETIRTKKIIPIEVTTTVDENVIPFIIITTRTERPDLAYDVEVGRDYHNSRSRGTPEQTGFWQALSVHCNQEDFNALLNAVSGETVVNTGDPTNKISAVVYTRKYSSLPSPLDFGNPAHPNSIARKTATVDFYTKECPFECTVDKNDPNATGGNGGNTNVNDTPGPNNSIGNNWGGTNDNDQRNDSRFVFFRDNETKRITTDTWFPKAGNTVNYEGEAPLSTTLIRWSEGTPELPGGSPSGEFIMTSAHSGKQLFDGSKTTPSDQANYSTAVAESGPTFEVLPGLHREFDVRGTWSSEQNKPQTFNFKWEYAPNVSTVVMTDNIGFGRNGTREYSQTTQTTRVEGKCYARYGTTIPFDTTQIAHDNTGEGTSNNTDRSLLEGPGDQDTNLTIKFIRAVAE